MTRLSLFDWAACGIAGADAAEFAAFRRAQMIEDGPAHVFGGEALGAAAAALLNGTLSHALDYDDTHFAHIGHPSVAVLPCVMALAETLAIPLTDAIDAATIGVEASILTGVWLGRAHYQSDITRRRRRAPLVPRWPPRGCWISTSTRRAMRLACVPAWPPA
jgi:2-methylcitrate dehydratase PrpD